MPRKPREIPAEWKKVDLSGLMEKIQNFAPSLSVTLGARRILYLFFEILEALEEANIPLPREGKVREWLEQHIRPRSIEQPAGESHRSIAQIIQKRNIVELSDETGISIKRLNEIAQGAQPRIAELSLLEQGLDVTLEELTELYKRDFNGQRERINGGL